VSELLEVDDLVVRYRIGRNQELTAVNGATLRLRHGQALGLVGESGCGKSSLAKAVAGVLPPTEGTIRVRGSELTSPRSKRDARAVQMVFQDPSSALNPALKIGKMLQELLLVHGLVANRRAAHRRAAELLSSVELPAGVLNVRPRALSGGQRQRVGIARALALEPDVLIADEAVAALDSVVKRAVIELIDDLRRRLDIGVIFVSHDLAAVRRLCDETIVMYLGEVVEQRSTLDLFQAPAHPYSAALLAAQPTVHERLDLSVAPALSGDPSSAIERPPGCAFAPRCPRATPQCTRESPPPHRVADGGIVRCHFPLVAATDLESHPEPTGA
jgi:oligopeptide/dipeptide ABC transporter ATP-binding protein